MLFWRARAKTVATLDKYEDEIRARTLLWLGLEPTGITRRTDGVHIHFRTEWGTLERWIEARDQLIADTVHADDQHKLCLPAAIAEQGAVSTYDVRLDPLIGDAAPRAFAQRIQKWTEVEQSRGIDASELRAKWIIDRIEPILPR
ncbi:hypothetical protein [Pengzhenrongella sicca]|uniref:Uncharacterized protein n=1 Tax=Pengzhenrongella sicca TaxID=2819238 RepID=A0A8A4ZMR8_9MICO|nr:hypothetical protein [Pengzhenrongella sicca]QTE30858.1 hypothetical protein J4E96_07995 [Pengzhenrongella sicca]